MKVPESCKKGDHKLEDIFSVDWHDFTSTEVRWCCECGAIVVDQDFDGRTNPGQVMKMKIPKIAQYG